MMDKIEEEVLVSIIMPAYNAANYIQEAIDSVINQTFVDWELIIVDDGSTDHTKEVIAKNVLVDERIHYYYQKNGKQGKARNLAISKSKGTYLAFLDADDFWIPQKLEMQLIEIEEKNVDLVFSDSYIFSTQQKIDSNKRMHTINRLLQGDEALRLFLIGNRIPNLTVLAKKEKIIAVGGFTTLMNIQNAEDYHLWLKLLIDGCAFYGSDKTLAYYRVHENSSTFHDKYASDQVIEALFNLLNKNPNVSSMIVEALKREFKRQSSKWQSQTDFAIFIDKNCAYLNKEFYAPFYKMLNYFVGVKNTRRFLNRLLNA
jgi:glycosyltransferase involved in cell wall biosynthesis